MEISARVMHFGRLTVCLFVCPLKNYCPDRLIIPSVIRIRSQEFIECDGQCSRVRTKKNGQEMLSVIPEDRSKYAQIAASWKQEWESSGHTRVPSHFLFYCIKFSHFVADETE